MLLIDDIQFLGGKAHNIAGGGHTAGNRKADHLTAGLDIRLQQRLGILQRRRRGFRRCLVCIRPRENAFGCDILAVPELIFAQQDMQRQNVDIVLCRQLL